MFVTISQYSYSLTLKQKEEPDKEKVDLIEGPSSEPNRVRSLFYVECFLDKTSNILEIEFDGIGQPVVYVLDQCNNIVCFTYADRLSNYVCINLPRGAGYYRLIIQSPEYYGEGAINLQR